MNGTWKHFYINVLILKIIFSCKIYDPTFVIYKNYTIQKKFKLTLNSDELNYKAKKNIKRFISDIFVAKLFSLQNSTLYMAHISFLPIITMLMLKKA